MLLKFHSNFFALAIKPLNSPFSHFWLIEKSFGGFWKKLKSTLVSSSHEVTLCYSFDCVVASRSLVEYSTRVS
jgi:hypothetical protein